jgi:hypothetical protein
MKCVFRKILHSVILGLASSFSVLLIRWEIQNTPVGTLPRRVDSCRAKRLHVPLKSPVGLISYPGSGNTWLRHIIEQLSGFTTASVYCDLSLVDTFTAECDAPQWFARNVVVKTHRFDCTWRKAIVLLRHPLPTILAYYHYKGIARKGPDKGGHAHVATVATSDWNWTNWHRHVADSCSEWSMHTSTFLGDPVASSSAGCSDNATDTTVLFYEDIGGGSTIDQGFIDAITRALKLTNMRVGCLAKDTNGVFKRDTPLDHPARLVYKDSKTLQILKERGCWQKYYAYRRKYGPGAPTLR